MGDPAPELSDLMLNIGVAVWLLIRKYRLRSDTVEDILGYLEYYSHLDWYWKLVETGGSCQRDVGYS